MDEMRQQVKSYKLEQTHRYLNSIQWNKGIHSVNTS